MIHDPSFQLQHDLKELMNELREELQRLNLYANRGDCLAVASVAYRMRRTAERNRLEVIEDGASKIEESARRNNVLQFTSEIQLLEHHLRWVSQAAQQPF